MGSENEYWETQVRVKLLGDVHLVMGTVWDFVCCPTKDIVEEIVGPFGIPISTQICPLRKC